MATHPVVHPSADALQALALGKLNDSTAAALLNHLDSCSDCRKQLAAFAEEDFVNRLRQARGQSPTSATAQTLTPCRINDKSSSSQPAIASLPPELATNQQYEILRELGRGGMGVVYLSKNRLMDRLEVLKVVNKALLDHPGAAERFLREIRSAAKLSHANVVGAYSAVQQGELLAFAMEYVEGQDLASLVKSQGPLPILNACYYVQQAASGLQHAFEKGMVHRDIKPQNLILSREGRKHIVKVLDFGLAKATREKKDDTGLTGEGKMLGTPDYIAPEQTLDAAKADIRADIYSLGCTLYYLLAGHPPFSGSSLTAVLLAHQMQEAKPLNLVRPEVPEDVAAVVRKMMAKSPDKRYQTPREVVQALNAFVKQGTAPKSSPELSAGATETKPAVKKETQVGRSPSQTAEPAKKRREPAAVWKSLTEGVATPVESKKSGAVRECQPATAMPSARKKGLMGGSIGVSVLLLALLAMWAGGVFKVKTKDGMIVLENVPSDAEVMVDGEQVTFDTGDGKPVEVRVAAGKKHRLQVKKDGFRVFGEEVEIDAGDQRIIRVSLQPEVAAAKPPQQKPGTANEQPHQKSAQHKPQPGTKLASKSSHPETNKGQLQKPPPAVASKKTSKPPSPGPIQATASPEFTPLFNGKDLTGWKTHPKQPGNWRVINGILVGNGPMTHLYSERGDYENFHYRVEAMISDGGNSGQYFRAQFGPGFPKGYEAQINSTGRDPIKTGSLYGLINVTEQLHKPDEWFTQEVIAHGDHIVIKVNGNTVVDTHDSRYKKGHFALQQHDSLTTVKFRKIEIMELPGGLTVAPLPSGIPPEAREAARDYEKACAEARAKFLTDFDMAVERLAKWKAPSTQRLTLMEAVKEEKKRFEGRGLIPWSEPMRPSLARYFVSMSTAEDKLRRAYLSLISAQMKAKKQSTVADLQAELTNLLSAKLLAKWRVVRDGRQPGWVACLYSDGRIYGINGNVTKGTWIYSNGVLTFRWPDLKAPGGLWLDSSSVSADGRAYVGTNNAPPASRAKFTGTYVDD